jgi:cystathionine beta-lyase/cystathionine gamma-synthase
MESTKTLYYIKEVLESMPEGWLSTTTHRLDIYDETQAKTQFLEQFEILYTQSNSDAIALGGLPTAYDYIRLGHPLSCVLEWTIAKLQEIHPDSVIAFSSQTIPVLAILRKNLLEQKKTQILYIDKLPEYFDATILKSVYGYNFDLKQIKSIEAIPSFDGSTILISANNTISKLAFNPKVDFYVNCYAQLGSILLINGNTNESYISDIQHVRRRETIAMTPANCHIALKSLLSQTTSDKQENLADTNKTFVRNIINKITGTSSKALVASSGLSIQYAIMMGLIDDALSKHPGKDIKFIVPPNCYGGTNDQARRVAAASNNKVEIIDLLVDGDNDMVQSIENILTEVASKDAVPYIIAEIPTNPRVEVPNLNALLEVLSKVRLTANGKTAVDPVFILDQTFCPNVHFLGEGEILSTVRTISFASGSKFPSGGKCTAGYCVGNQHTNNLINTIEKHLMLCDNEATDLQYALLAKQLPSMNQRIIDAYKNTRAFVNFIHEVLPEAKINFVSEELATQGFMPSVFSLDLPTKGATTEEKENHKRALNHQLIHRMITEIPDESKYCVSYGQLKGCYWTIPATSTQGTTKEGDKDYIARVALSPDLDLERHKKVFLDFVKTLN